MKPIRPRPSFIAMIILSVSVPLLAASERTMYVEYIPKAEFDHGRGFDATALEVLGQCVEGTVITLGSGSQSVNSEMSQVETSSQLDDSLDIGAAASLGYGSFSMSAAAKYAQSHSLTSYSLTYAAKSQIDSATLALQAPRLKDEFRNLNLAEFRRRCGDYYVDGITTGGEYIAMVTISTNSSQDKQDVEAQMNAAISFAGEASLAANFGKSMNSLASSHEVKITEIRKGGAGEPIAVSPATMIENYANFARSVAEKPAYYEVILKKYSTLANYPYDSSDPFLEPALNTLDTLADLSHSWGTVLNDISYFKNHPKQFSTANPETLASWETDVRSILSTLSAAVRTCATNYRTCSVPALSKQPTYYTNLYPSWKPAAEWVRVDIGGLGAVRAIAVGSKDIVWALVAGNSNPAGGFGPKQLNGNAWKDMPGGLTSLSVGADGSVWGVNASNDVFRWDGNSWTLAGAAKLVNISVGSGNDVFGVDTAGEAVRWTAPNWEKVGVSMPLEQISVGSDGYLALRSKGGDLALFGRNLSELKPIVKDRPIVDVAVGGKDNVYVIDVNGDLFAWDSQSGQLGGSLGKFTKVSAAADGTVWAVNGQGQLFRLSNM